MDTVVEKASSALGVPDDLFRIAFCIVASFALCSVLKRIPSSNLFWKDVFITACGVFYLAGIFHLYWGTLYLLANAVVTYYVVSLLPSNPKMPLINFVVQMLLMFATHCTEQFSSGDFVNVIGISGSQMVMLQKLTSYAWDVYDGTKSKHEERKHHSPIKTRPSLLRYLSWLFFFPTVLTGPSCTFNEYNNWLDMSVFKGLKTVNGEPLKRAPRSGLPLFLKIGEGLIWVFVYTQFGSLYEDYQLYKHDWYLKLPFVRRVLTVYVLALLYRTKYYSAWLLSEAACIHSGLSFNGLAPHTGKLRWDRMSNVRPMSVETAQNFHAVFANWNIITSKWLRNYVYIRVTPDGQKPGAQSTFITFLTSALWHGTRPGYYITFVFGSVYQMFGKVYRRLLRPVFIDSPLKWSYDVVCLGVTQLSLSFVVMPFILLDLKPSLQMWLTVYFYPLVGLAISWLLLLGPLSGFIRPKLRLLSRDLKKTT